MTWTGPSPHSGQPPGKCALEGPHGPECLMDKISSNKKMGRIIKREKIVSTPAFEKVI